jgi:hypothetical protein
MEVIEIFDILGKKANELPIVDGDIPFNNRVMVADQITGQLYQATQSQMQKFSGADLNDADITNIVNNYLASNSIGVASRTNNIVSFKRTGNTVYDIVDQYTGEYISLNKATTKPGGSSVIDADVDNIIYFKLGTEYFKRNYSDLNVRWFNVKGDGSNNDAPGLNAVNNYFKTLTTKPIIKLEAGTYKCNSEVAFDGGTSNGIPYIEGAGPLNTVFDFTNATGNTGIRFGNSQTTVSTRANSLHGGIKGIKIIGTPSIDGLINASYAPTATAFNVFEDIYIFNCRDGVNYAMNPSNESSGFRNIYRNIRIEKYSRVGFTANGAYNDHYGVFVTQPNGETNTISPDLSKGASNLGLNVNGSNMTFHGCQFEDQIYSLGASCTFYNCTIENMLKGQGHPLCGDSAVIIAGVDNQFINFKMTTLNKIVIKTGIKVFAPNTALINVSYANPAGPDFNQFILEKPIIPFGSSSGVIINSSITATLAQNDPSIINENWAYLNVLIQGDEIPFYKIPTIPPSLENVIATNPVATSTPEFRGGMLVGDYSEEKPIEIEGSVDFQTLGVTTSRVKGNNIDVMNGGVSLQYLKDKGGRATASVSGGSVTGVSVTAHGTYSSVPAVFFAHQTGKGAQGTATLGSGGVASVTVTEGGENYDTAPDVYFLSFNDGVVLDEKGQTTIASLKLGGVQDFADNTAAINGGLNPGDVYKTGDALKIVH